MPQAGFWLRIFVGLLLAVLPPIVLLVGVLLLTESVLQEADPNLTAVLVIIGAVVWAGILAIVYARGLNDDIRSFISLARRGDHGDDLEIGSAYQQLANSLEERNRQVGALARQAGQVPIDDEPQRVIAALVSAVRSVLGDATWRLAVLSSDDPQLLPPGVHNAAEENRPPDDIGDMERWASVSASAEPVRRADGPWGAFTIVTVSVSERLRALLYAPWEGRIDPTPAETDLLTLVGQHAGTALEHSLLYARVRSQADELNRLAAIQADFLRGVTHDLQTPLTSIGALATELRANENMPEVARSDLESIAHQAERLRRMVSQLLVASRLEAGVLTPQQEVFAVPPLVERTWAALRADRPFSLVVKGAPHLAVGDPDRTEQVLWALLDNAVKYSPAGSPIAVTIEPQQTGQLSISVTDRGTGMDSETQQRAFDQFFRADEARALAPDGSGVGLFAARGLIEAMGGTVKVTTRLGAGTVMTVELPAEVVDSDPPSGARER
ncbi:MAG: sensor histidine kinase [Candidatus Limnocylindria bacterium]